MHRPRVSPALVVAMLALFLAAGGSGFALARKTAPQARCATGAVRGVAIVTGNNTGIANLPQSYSSSNDLFAYKWNCTGGAVQVQRAPSSNAFDVKFVGNSASVAVASGYGDPAGTSVTREPDGAFRVLLSGQIDNPEANSYGQKQVQFVIVAF